MELSAALNQVRKLIELAEHEGTPVHEAQAARERADSIMLKYAFDEALARATKPVTERDKPDIMFLTPTRGVTYSWWLAEKLVKYTRCMMREVYESGRGYVYKVYGFKSDLAYLEVLYTEVMLHMSAVLVPHWDKTKSLDENAYALHQMGLNWLQIAELLGWRKDGILERDGKFQERWVLKRTDAAYQIPNGDGGILTEMSNWQLGSYFKRACQRATKARGEDQHMRIAANGTENYRRSAAEGYVIEYHERLRQAERARQSGTEVVLAGAADDLAAFFRSENEDLFAEQAAKQECKRCKAAKSGHCREHPPASAYKLKPRDEQAYRIGVAHAKTAPLGGSRGMGGERRAVDA